MTDFSGASTDFPISNPSLQPTSAGATISTLLGEQLSLVDIVANKALKPSEGEKLSLFNTGEKYVGTIEVKQPAWMAKVGGGEAGAATGSAKAPMREWCFVLFPTSSLTLFRHHSLEDRASLCRGGTDGHRRNPPRDGRGHEDCE